MFNIYDPMSCSVCGGGGSVCLSVCLRAVYLRAVYLSAASLSVCELSVCMSLFHCTVDLISAILMSESFLHWNNVLSLY